jgi:hypothetical protein
VIDVELYYYYRRGFPLPYLKPQDPAIIWYLDVKSTTFIIILLYVLSKDGHSWPLHAQNASWLAVGKNSFKVPNGKLDGKGFF